MAKSVASAKVQLRDLSVVFDAPALQKITLEVRKGELFGLIGPGAAGKSVLLKAVAGLVPSAHGEVLIDGTLVDVSDTTRMASLRRGIGMQFQNNALFDFLSVADNVAFPARRLLSLSEDELQRRVTQRLESVGLPGFESRLPRGLSGGQRKRVGIARATITQPSLLLYDEPAAGLDPVSSQKIFELLRREQQANGTTAIMVSSDLDRMLSVTDRIGMLYEGKLLFVGTTQEALDSQDPAVRQFVHGLEDGPL